MSEVSPIHGIAFPGTVACGRGREEAQRFIETIRMPESLAEKRILELDKLFVSSCEEEQQALKAAAESLRKEIDIQERQNQNGELFIQKSHQDADLDEMTAAPPTIRSSRFALARRTGAAANGARASAAAADMWVLSLRMNGCNRKRHDP